MADEQAERAVERIDYDFAKLKIDRSTAIATAIRALYLDRWAGEALDEHPDAVVLHLGCGLDTRSDRLSPGPGVTWYDVDYPEVIEIRRRLFSERPGHHQVAASVTDPAWLAGVQADRPAVIVAEGLVQYLAKEQIAELFTRLVTHFPSGVVMFDAWNSLAMRSGSRQKAIKASGAKLGGFGINDPRIIEALVPGLRFDAEQTFLDVPEMANFSKAGQTAFKMMNHVPALRNMGRLLRYRF
ncbi:class I SAM-dependent methyltransferase [Actinomadura luteofluorescens]|uniref:class I SAM-dependent methyltransferase n=2 Tax=Actinomadura luteofluorescens TaxID=46163 RepID=UPI0027DCD7F2|nr:class I SAM-dependent methyltransferase [Actinomadura glauciflava]